MKKILVFLMGCFCMVEPSYAQSPLLDGQQFTIQLFLNKEKDIVDTLYFESSGMRFASQKKYGFIEDSYKAKEKKGAIAFEAVYKSKKNGTMIFEGQVTGEKIDGTLMWEMYLQNPVNYTFIKKEEIK